MKQLKNIQDIIKWKEYYDYDSDYDWDDKELWKMVDTAMFQLHAAEKNEKYVFEEAFTKEEFDFCMNFWDKMIEMFTEKNVKEFARIIDKCTKDYR